jgi:hypothetical protein
MTTGRNDLGHRETDRDDGVEEPVGERVAGNRHAEHDSGDRADQEAGHGTIERHGGVEQKLAGNKIVPDPLQHRAQRRQHEGGEGARARRELPGERKRDDGARPRDTPAHGLEPTKSGRGFTFRLEVAFKVGLARELGQWSARRLRYSCHRSILCMSAR